MDSSAQRGLLYIPYGLVHLSAAHSFNSHSFDNLLTVEPALGGPATGNDVVTAYYRLTASYK